MSSVSINTSHTGKAFIFGEKRKVRVKTKDARTKRRNRLGKDNRIKRKVVEAGSLYKAKASGALVNRLEEVAAQTLIRVVHR